MKINAITLSGSAEINATTTYDFILNITAPVFEIEHERVKMANFKIKTKSIVETFSFEELNFFIILEEENKIIQSNENILRRLADSWLVKIADAIDIHFINPQILKQSELFLNTHKKSLIEDVCSIFKTQVEIDSSITIPSFNEMNILSKDKGSYNYYQFDDIKIENILKFIKCEGNSLSSYRKNHFSCTYDNYFVHNIMFVFTYSSENEPSNSTINWSIIKKTSSEYDSYNNRHRSDSQKETNIDIFKYINLEVSIISNVNRNIKKIKEIYLHFETEKLTFNSEAIYKNIFLKYVRQYLADKIKTSINSELNLTVL